MKRVRFSPWLKRLLIIPPIVLGVVVVATLVRARSAPEQREIVERRTAVRVLPTERTSVVPRLLGYGVVQPRRIWQVVPQVAGRVIEKSPRAEAGASAQEGLVLLRIDPRPFELAIHETEAQIAKLVADLAELSTRETNTQRTLDIELRSLQASERELARKEKLVEENIVAQSDFDQEEARYLQQLVRVGDLENSLKLIPAERQAVEANKLASEAKLEIAKLDRTYTEIAAPFDCRIASIDFEEAQYVGVGQVLAVAHGVSVAEIVAQVPVTKMRHLITEMPTGAELMNHFLTGDIIRELGLEATVRLRGSAFSTEWEARVARISGTIDPETRTLGVVVAVDDPYEQARPGSRPPLVPDMFCEVELRGRAKPDRALVPRAALHDGEVYVAVDGRLERRSVEVEFTLLDYACLSSGLEDGDLVVVSDPIPAIAGMLLDTTVDTELEDRIASVASGESPVR